jgi:cytochrome c1
MENKTESKKYERKKFVIILLLVLLFGLATAYERDIIGNKGRLLRSVQIYEELTDNGRLHATPVYHHIDYTENGKVLLTMFMVEDKKYMVVEPLDHDGDYKILDLDNYEPALELEP